MLPYIIAEIGGSHQGDLHLAKQLIDAVKSSGAHCAKFQAVFADEIVHPLSGEIPLPTGMVSLYKRFKELERPYEFYAQLKSLCDQVGLDFLCTPFGLTSFALLEKICVNAYKVASPELNHLPLLSAIAQTQKPVFLSLGVSRLSDIELAIETIDGRSPITLLHCITSYPAPEEEYNIRLLPALSTLFGVHVGISDHSMDPILVPALATLHGAVAIEKHICLSRKGDGLDDPIALEPNQFAQMVQAIHQAATDPNFIHELTLRYGQEKIQATLGSGHKQLADSERANYGRSNRSICAIHAIQAGQVLTSENTGLYRVEKNLRPGLIPAFWPNILGRKATMAIPAGQGIRWQDVS